MRGLADSSCPRKADDGCIRPEKCRSRGLDRCRVSGDGSILKDETNTLVGWTMAKAEILMVMSRAILHPSTQVSGQLSAASCNTCNSKQQVWSQSKGYDNKYIMPSVFGFMEFQTKAVVFDSPAHVDCITIVMYCRVQRLFVMQAVSIRTRHIPGGKNLCSTRYRYACRPEELVEQDYAHCVGSPAFVSRCSLVVALYRFCISGTDAPVARYYYTVCTAPLEKDNKIAALTWIAPNTLRRLHGLVHA